MPSEEPKQAGAPEAGVVLRRDSMRSIGRSRIAVPVAIVLALLVLVVNETGYRSAQHFELASSDAVAARLALVQLRRQLVAAESAQRGYLITARPEYKAPFLQARAELQGKVEELQRRFGPDHPHAQAVRRLEKAAVERISELDEVLRLFELGDRERAVTLVLTDIGREKMDAVDENVELIESATLTAFLGHQARQQQALAWSHVGIAVLTLFGLLVVLASLRQLRLRESERAQQQAELQAERDKLETEVAARTAELTEIATHLQTVREDERGRLARELHDELGGLMTAAKVDVARLKNKLGAMPDSMSERIAHLVQLLDAAIALKRRIIEDLQPSALKHLGLQTALQIMCDEVARASEIEITTTIEDITLSEQRALTIYRLVQEALTNAIKYAGARHLAVSLSLAGDTAVVNVADDGRGFDTAAPGGSGHGLAGMRFRIRSGGGQMQVESASGRGTTIRASLPVSD